MAMRSNGRPLVKDAARSGKRIGRALAVAAGLGFAALSAAPAAAACYEGIGCSQTDRFAEEFLLGNAACDILWEMRNSVFKEHGYCFKTEKAIGRFGNDGCTVRDQGAIRLNPVEQANMTTIIKVEKLKGCAN